MIQKALNWAKSANRLRTNPVHGEEELHLVLNDTFVAKELEEEEVNREGTIQVEVGLRLGFIS